MDEIFNICSICGDSFNCNNNSCKCQNYYYILNRYSNDNERKKLINIFDLDNYAVWYKTYENKEYDLIKESYILLEELYRKKDNRESFEIREYYRKIYELLRFDKALIQKFSSKKFIDKCINENLKRNNRELEELGICFINN